MPPDLVNDPPKEILSFGLLKIRMEALLHAKPGQFVLDLGPKTMTSQSLLNALQPAFVSIPETCLQELHRNDGR
ncbi:hypothetical protein [Xanthobacter autotrophicus]|uniref:hypothetical protein n=1 Tax=Xanthobacter autotrophicus TaxID=280 RepID=UPI00372B8BA9